VLVTADDAPLFQSESLGDMHSAPFAESPFDYSRPPRSW
jgi:hypothetical protein